MLRMRPCRPARWTVLAVAAWMTAGLVALPVPVAAQQDADAEATRQYAVALGFQKRKLYRQAAERWQRFIEAHAGDERIANAHYHLGVCRFQERQFAEAEKTFRTVLDRFPQFAHRDGAQFNLGLVRYNAALESEKPEEYRQAAAAFAEVAAKFAESDYTADALYYQAECLLAAGDAEAAIPVYRKAIADHADSPLQPDLHYALGTTLEELDEHEQAAEVFQAFLQKFPEAEQAQECRLRLGLAQLQLEKYAEAEKLFAECASVAEFEHADFALLQQARAVLEQEKLPEAASLYESLPEKFAESGYVGASLLAAGKVRYRLEQFPQAETALANVAKNDEWDDYNRRSLTRLGTDEEYQLQLRSGELLQLLRDLAALYRYGRKQGIPAGQVELVKMERRLAQLLDLSDDALTELLNRHPEDGIQAFHRLLRWLGTHQDVSDLLRIDQRLASRTAVGAVLGRLEEVFGVEAVRALLDVPAVVRAALDPADLLVQRLAGVRGVHVSRLEVEREPVGIAEPVRVDLVASLAVHEGVVLGDPVRLAAVDVDPEDASEQRRDHLRVALLGPEVVVLLVAVAGVAAVAERHVEEAVRP
jgi:TolA-binding protein